MCADTKPYPPASVVGAIVLSRLGIPPGRHALDIEAVGLVTGQLDRLPSRGEYKKVIRCDTCSCKSVPETAVSHWYIGTIYESSSGARRVNNIGRMMYFRQNLIDAVEQKATPYGWITNM